MDDLRKQIHLARRRLVAQRFVSLAPRILTVTLLLAVVAILTKKLLPIPVSAGGWAIVWIGGALVVGLAAALVRTIATAEDDLWAAIELDQRCGLRERVSSCLALTEEQQLGATGQALIFDATRRVARAEVQEQFRVRGNRWIWVPFVLVAIAFGLTQLADAPSNSNGAHAAVIPEKEENAKRVKTSTQQLMKRTEVLKQAAEQQGLKDATQLFRKIEAGAKTLSDRDKVDRQRALVKLNDLAKQVQARKSELLNADEIRNQLKSLKSLQRGPADQMMQAIKQGDFQKAFAALQKLQKSLSKGQLSAEQQAELQAQLSQMSDKLRQMAAAQQQVMAQLQRQIQQKIEEGDRPAAAQLQAQLEQMMQQTPQMDKMSNLAQKLGAAAEGMKNNAIQEANQTLDHAATALDGMQQELNETAMLEQAMEMIGDAKNGMNCQSCQGGGCRQCQAGQGSRAGQGTLSSGGRPAAGQGGGGDGTGEGLGEGQGRGDRPEEVTEYDTYDSSVQAKIRAGQAVFGGEVPGPNRPGQAIEGIKQAIQAASASQDDPLTGQRLPKPQRELTRDYFRALNGE